METLKETDVFKFNPDTLESVRKFYGLDQPGRMEEALKIIEEWIEKQDHFVKKKFDREYLERFIIFHKGQIERVKKRLELKCTLVNQVKFMGPNCLKDPKIFELGYDTLLPKLTKDNIRIYLGRFKTKDISNLALLDLLRYYALYFEYNLRNDYNCGYYNVLDLRDTNLKQFASVFSSISDFREFTHWAVDVNGIRCKQLHLITKSSLVDMLVSLFKSFSKTKKVEVFVHPDLESLHKVIPKELLPADYGGDEETLAKLHEKWMEIFLSKEFTDYVEFIRGATIDESRRPDNELREEYLGIQGTFRSLVVD